MKKYYSYIKYVNPLYLIKVWKDKSISLTNKIVTSLPLIGIFILAIVNSKLENSMALEYNSFLKDYNCEEETWEVKGRDVVKTFNIINVSREMNEGLFLDNYSPPSTIDGIRCNWAKDLIYMHGSYFRKANIFLGYPKNEEYVDCFCKGFVIAAEEYILEKNQ